MSTTSDDVEQLISRLAGPLSPRDRAAFRRAAEDALARVPCWGEGAVYRAVASLQRAFFDPPPDARVLHGPRHNRTSKLIAAEAVGRDDPRTGGRDRHRLQAVEGSAGGVWCAPGVGVPKGGVAADCLRPGGVPTDFSPPPRRPHPARPKNGDIPAALAP